MSARSPILEETGAPYASRTPGAMHACGHDGHTAMLLGAAKYLAETRNFDGTVVVIFQPAEEGGGGGREMVEDGIMDRFGIGEVYAATFGPHVVAGMVRDVFGRYFEGADPHRIETVEQLREMLTEIAPPAATPPRAPVSPVPAVEPLPTKRLCSTSKLESRPGIPTPSNGLKSSE